MTDSERVLDGRRVGADDGIGGRALSESGPIAPDAPPALQVELLEALLDVTFGTAQREFLHTFAATGPGTALEASLRTRFPLSGAKTSVLGATIRMQMAHPQFTSRIVLARGPAGWLMVRADGPAVLEILNDAGDVRLLGSPDEMPAALQELTYARDLGEELERCAAARCAVVPPDVRQLLLGTPLPHLVDLLYRPLSHDEPPALSYALQVLNAAKAPAPPGLLPLLPVDDRSLACLVCDGRTPWTGWRPPVGAVIRWHLDLPAGHPAQGEVLDVDALTYVASVEEELAARAEGISRYRQFTLAYEKDYLAADKTPRGHVPRPMRLACQNVIVGQAVIAHVSSIDALAAPVWHTCEVPHLRAHEGVRGLAALVLADAFHNGGTMEISFAADPGARLLAHPEGGVPAALRRFGRVRGIPLGGEDPAALTPAEARNLYLAVTPMPDSLRRRVESVVAAGTFTPERLCYLLSSGTFTALELEFILATSSRAASILRGGAQPLSRAAAAAEAATMRAALMVGMLERRLANDETARTVVTAMQGTDAAESGGWATPAAVAPMEDLRAEIVWNIDDTTATLRLDGLAQPLPWGYADHDQPPEALTVVPRCRVGMPVLELVNRLSETNHTALLLPADIGLGDLTNHPLASAAQVLRCPETLRQLDQAAARILSACRVGRA